MENTGQVALAVLPPAPEVPPFHFNFSLFPLNLLQERKPPAGTCHTTPSREEKKDVDRFPSSQDKGLGVRGKNDFFLHSVVPWHGSDSWLSN